MISAQKFLKGEYSLPLTFWSGIGVVIVLKALYYTFNYAYQNTITTALSYAFLSIVMIAWTLGTWEAANQYKGATVWATLAKIVVGLNLLKVLIIAGALIVVSK